MKLLNYYGTKAYGTTIIYANYCCACFVTASHICFCFLLLFVRLFFSFFPNSGFILVLIFFKFFFIRFGFFVWFLLFVMVMVVGSFYPIVLLYCCFLLRLNLVRFIFQCCWNNVFFSLLILIVGAQRLLQLCYMDYDRLSRIISLFLSVCPVLAKFFFCSKEHFQIWLNENEWWIFSSAVIFDRYKYIYLSVCFVRCHHQQ